MKNGVRIGEGGDIQGSKGCECGNGSEADAVAVTVAVGRSLGRVTSENQLAVMLLPFLKPWPILYHID